MVGDRKTSGQRGDTASADASLSKEIHNERLALNRSRRKLLKNIREICCPICGFDPRIRRIDFLKFDRYLLPITFSICGHCSLVYSSRNLAGQDLRTFYQHYYRDYYEEIRTVSPVYIYESRDKLKAAYRWLEISRVVGEIDSVLEIGSGLGFFLQRCRVEGVDKLLGLELGLTFSSYSQSKLSLGSIVHQCSYESIGEIGFDPGLIVMFHVFEHLEDPAAALAWIRSVASQKSKLVIEVPDLLGDWSRLGLSYFHIAHRTYWTEQTLCSLLRCCGFRIVSVSRDDSDGIFPGNLRVIAELDEPFKHGQAIPKVDLLERNALLKLIKGRLSTRTKVVGGAKAIARKVLRSFRISARDPETALDLM